MVRVRVELTENDLATIVKNAVRKEFDIVGPIRILYISDPKPDAAAIIAEFRGMQQFTDDAGSCLYHPENLRNTEVPLVSLVQKDT
jgi:hypothetical protein